MKSLRIAVPMLLILSSFAFAQNETKKSEVSVPAPKSEAQTSFAMLKGLAGTWEGKITVVPPMPEMNGKTLDITMRVTSRGNALVHEMQEAGTPFDPTKYDHPVTMFYLEDGHLLLTHYCDAGNRPRMQAKVSPDGKTVEFEFVDAAGRMQYGHMHHAVFTAIDADHHTEDWTFMLPGDKHMQAHFDLHRKQ